MKNQLNQKSVRPVASDVNSSPDLFVLETVDEFGLRDQYVAGIDTKSREAILSNELPEFFYGSKSVMSFIATLLIESRSDNNVGSHHWLSLVTPGRGFFDLPIDETSETSK